jgi:hypothetical protein
MCKVLKEGSELKEEKEEWVNGMKKAIDEALRIGEK